MKPDIIGRKHEIEILEEITQNKKSELVVVYGRRRVGKTFLIRKFFEDQMTFEITGLYGGSLSDQLDNFTNELKKRSNGRQIEVPTKWPEAFQLLAHHIDRMRSKKRKVIFIDEFPWMATAKSKFLMAFENFWNHYATKRNDLIVVICGSAASYMVHKIIRNKGGLHNRISQKIKLLPFTLRETQQFLLKNGINYTTYDILQLYMAMGGIPHYLEKLRKGDSVAQNIDRLCFEKDGVLNDEFNQLYKSLFDDSEKHMTIIRTLAKIKKGITRNELGEKSKIPTGGDFSLKLEELIESGFVAEYTFHKNKKQRTLYRLSDEYSAFYLKFIEGSKHEGKGTWQRQFSKQSYKTWSGISFEVLCLKHINQIKKALRIDAVYSTSDSWFNKNTQIDLLIDRDDNIINLCEMKFYNTQFTIDKNYYANLKKKVAEFKLDSKTKKNVFVTMITTFGVKQNQYSTELVENELSMESLFID